MEYFDLLACRRSTRRFLPEPITQEQLDRILLAAHRAPIGSNRRGDVHLTVVRDPEILEQLRQASRRRYRSLPRNNEIFEQLDPAAIDRAVADYDPFYGASTVIFVSHKRQTVQPGIEYTNVASPVFAMHLAAQELGLGSVYMWFALESMRLLPEWDRTERLGLPGDFEPLLGLAVGYTDQTFPERPVQPLSVDYL